MSGYIGNIPVPQATQTRDAFVATSGQTVFATGGYTPNYVDVYLNGVKLVDGDDFTATNGSDVVLTVGATAGDQVEVIAFTAFNVMNVSYNDLLDVPTFATVATTGDYGDLLNTPAPFDPNTLATVATTGSYTDLINIPANIVTDAAYVHTDNNYTTTEKNKLAGIEAGATADQTAAEILTAIKTVDGAGSGLDADTLDGQHASAFLTTSGKAADSNLLDGIDSGSFLRSDATDNFFGGVLVINNDAGVDITNTGSINGLQIYQPSVNADALITFHVAGDFALHFGLDGDTNDLAIGGWSMGATKYKVWHAGNLTPPSTSTGAVGSYAYMARYGGLSAGSTYAGSELYYGGVIHWGMAANTRQDTVNTWRSSSTGAGTWRAMGTSLTSTGGEGGGTLCVRIS